MSRKPSATQSRQTVQWALTSDTLAHCDAVRRGHPRHQQSLLMGPETFYGGGAHGYTDYSFLDPKSADAVMVEPTAA
jgi:hypothetical protein